MLTTTFVLLIHKGTLDHKELQAASSEVMMKEVTSELVQMVCAEFDKDGNGTIDMSEFAMMVVRT
jgi:Ca2+-binding EF-hand superfamily protein